MARSRMIKPEFWDDEKLAKASRDARLIFIGLWNHSDDYGVVKGNVVWLKNHILPYEDSLSIQKFSGWLTELEKGGWIIKFDADGESFYFIRNFLRHQSINRPSKQRNPIPPDNINDYSLNIHGVLTDETETETEVKQKQKQNVSPTLDEVTQYFSENGIDPSIGKEAFDYYEAGNWHDSQGKPVKNWKQKMRGVWFHHNGNGIGKKHQVDNNKEAVRQFLKQRLESNG